MTCRALSPGRPEPLLPADGDVTREHRMGTGWENELATSCPGSADSSAVLLQ